MTGWMACPAVERDPHQIGGGSTFAGTHFPLSAPFEYLESEATVQQFREWFPELQECQIAAVLERRTASSRTDLPGTRIPPLQPDQCPCCGYTGRPDRPPCSSDSALCRRCRESNCPHGRACPGPLGKDHRQQTGRPLLCDHIHDQVRNP